MDAARDVEGTVPPLMPKAEFKSAHVLREEIEATSRILHEHVDELRERLHHKIDSIRNPWGLHDRVSARPLAACGVALVVGAALGWLRGDSTARGVVAGIGPTVRSTIAGQVASRVLDRIATASRLL